MKKFINLREVKAYLGCANEDEDGNIIEATRVAVTPRQAKYLLKHCNKANRRINKAHVETLKRDMENGNWYNDIDYIGFNREGMLINGQHRLKALSEANVESIYLKFDFNTEQHISMDTGRTRKYTDQITISKKFGVEILPNKWKSIVTAGLKINNPKLNLSNTELFEIGQAYGEDLAICDEKGLFDLGKKASGITVKSSLFWAYLSGVDIEVLTHMADVLRDGIAKADTDIPIIRLRDELIDLKGSSKVLDTRRAAYTQQCIYSILQGSTSNRLPSNPIMHYQDYPFNKRIESLKVKAE